VRFWLDNTAMSGTPWRIENSAPYDFNGGTVTMAYVFNSATLPDGPHSISSQIQFTNGTSQALHASFNVANTSGGDTTPPAAPDGLAAVGSESGISLDWNDNTEADLAGYNVYRASTAGGPFTKLNTSLVTASAFADAAAPAGATSYYRVTAVDTSNNESAPATAQADRPNTPPQGTYDLLVSKSSNRSNPIPLHGQTVSGNIFVFTAPDTSDILRVRFYLNDPDMANAPRLTENNSPYDFNGGTVTFGKAFDTRTLPNGSHTITAAIQFIDGSLVSLNAVFDIQN
jgi:hypothetical protein